MNEMKPLIFTLSTLPHELAKVFQRAGLCMLPELASLWR